jgi:hypothetical protein
MSKLISRLLALLMAGLFIITCICAAAATCPVTNLTVLPSAVTIDNPGALTSGMTVAVTVRVDFPKTGGPTYPETNQLELSTALDDPVWTWNIVRNGVKKPETEDRKSRVVIRGDVLSWPEHTNESLEINLYGTAPLAPQTENRTLLKIQDITTTTCTNTPVYQYNAFVINTTITRQKISSLETELAQLRVDTDIKKRAGTDTTWVMKKIEEAQQNLETANTTPPLQYASVGFAINNTEAAIADGRRLLGAGPVPSNSVPEQVQTPGMQTTPSQQTVPSPSFLPVFVAIVAGACAVIVRRWVT